MRDLEKARAELARFTDEDQPAYARWLSAAFGPLLTEARQLKETLRQKLLLIEELETERYIRGGSRYSAYYAVKRRRDSPPPQPPDNGWSEPDEPGESPEPDISEAEKEALFEEFARATFGINPRHLPREDYETLRAEFIKAMFGEDANDGEDPPTRSMHAPRDGGPVSARIKEKYRWLVRQLHPDTHSKKRPDLIAIWHEVQKAYMERDLERLETLVALVELREGLLGEQTSLFQARGALAEMQSALRALTRSLKEARREPMWRFSLAGAEEREALRVRVGFEINQSIDSMTFELIKVEKVLATWSTRPPERGRHVRPRARDAARNRQQSGFQF